jgi:type I restriction enzyme S subunit
MKLKTFFEKFDAFADAPDAVAKMRELILESAIRGQLIPQNPSDEPASLLLQRMASVQAGQARKQTVSPPVGDDAYLQIPRGWAWTRLCNTGRIFNGNSVNESGKTELAKVEEGIPFIATKDVGYGRTALMYDNGLKVPLRDPRFKVARTNAVLICAEGGSAGKKIGVTDRDICFGNKLYANEVWEGIHHRYVYYVYQAPTFYKEFAARMTGIIGGIARSQFLALPFPLPPLAEQKRIVAKVDELMALCDRLEAQQQERQTRHAAIARASLARFADAPTPANLNLLFHKSYTIPPADLRKSILTLAVQGKLVPKKERWIHRKLQDVAAQIVDCPHSTPKWTGAGRVCVRTSQFRPGLLDLSETRFVSEQTYQERIQRLEPAADDILYSREGGILGVACRVPSNVSLCLGQRMMLIRAGDSLVPAFLELVLNSPTITKIARERTTGGAAPRVNVSIVKSYPIPLPTLAEQRRIVAKVDQLMALVDELETQLATSRATAKNLLDALVVELTAADPQLAAAS